MKILFSIVGMAMTQAVIASNDSMKPPIPLGPSVLLDHKNLRRQAKSTKGAKRNVMVQVCHKTGNQSSKSAKGCGWQDLEFDDNGLSGHLKHGDYQGTCASTLCNDQDLCTLDYFDTKNCCTHQPVVCGFGKLCDPNIGCVDAQECPDDGKALEMKC
jgi:hypothetical protein